MSSATPIGEPRICDGFCWKQSQPFSGHYEIPRVANFPFPLQQSIGMFSAEQIKAHIEQLILLSKDTDEHIARLAKERLDTIREAFE